MFKRADYQLESGAMQSYAWPGGYPLYYVTLDCSVLCPTCAGLPDCRHADEHDPQWYLAAAEINYEYNHCFCDHCGRQIEPAYDLE